MKDLIKRALEEDIGQGDITTLSIIPEDKQATGIILSKGQGIVAGLEIARQVFLMVDPKVDFHTRFKDGDGVRERDVLAQVSGNARGLLQAERTALNFLQRLSGIATRTKQFVEKVQGTKAKILDTRKTVPGLRYLDKWAVQMGGGTNHRLGLHDAILIKDNHIELAGGVYQAIQHIKLSRLKELPIEIEVKNLDEFKEALAEGVDRILLDNMTLPDIEEAVRRASGKTKCEVSGGVTLESVHDIAKTGVDFISVGALTHSAPAFDCGFDIIKV